MAWASVGTLGTATSTSAGATLSLTAAADAEVGNVVLLIIAKDNAASADGNTSEVTGVADDAGNTWAKLREFCNAQGGAAAGATVSIWYSVVVNGITGGDIIEATFSGSITSKAMIGWEFTVSASAVITVEGSADLANDAADPGSMAISSLASREYLFVRGIATESNDATLITVTSSYTTFGRTVANTGTSATSMGIRGEFRILTGTGDTSDPTLFSADHASTYIALKEAVPPAGGQANAMMLLGCGG